jgi:uncharacterized membrane protein
VVKAVTWRIGGSLFTAAIAWVFTENASAALAIGGADMVVKIGAFYVHERVWERISFGRSKSPEYEI